MCLAKERCQDRGRPQRDRRQHELEVGRIVDSSQSTRVHAEFELSLHPRQLYSIHHNGQDGRQQRQIGKVIERQHEHVVTLLSVKAL